MKKIFVICITLIFGGLITLGFSCGSPEFESAKLSYSQGKYEEALSFLEKDLQKNSKSPDTWYYMGKVKGMMGNYEGMNEAFKRSLELSNDYTDSIRYQHYYFWGEHLKNAAPYMDSLQYGKALVEYKKAAAAWPDTSVTYRGIGLAYGLSGDLDNAVISFKKAWEMSQDTASYRLYGRFILQRGLNNKESFETDNTAKILLNKNLKEIGKGYSKNDVTDAFGEPSSKKKDKKNPKREDWVYDKYGITLTLEGDRVAGKKVNKQYEAKIDSTLYKNAVKDFNAAVDVFEMVKKIKPDDNDNLNLLLQAYVGANRIQEATKAFRLAIQNDPGNKTNRYILGVLYRSIEEFTNAIDEFKEAINIDPEYIDAIYAIGATYYNWGVRLKKEAKEKGVENMDYRKKFEDALPWMEKASQLKDDNWRVWDSLATIYAILGQQDKAEKAYSKVDALKKAGK